MSHSEIVRHKNSRPKSSQHSGASVEGISLKNNHQYDMFDKRVHYLEKVRSIFLQHCVVPILLMWEFKNDAKILSGSLKSSVLEDLDMKCFQMFWYSRNLKNLICNSGIIEHEFMTFSTYLGNFPCYAGS